MLCWIQWKIVQLNVKIQNFFRASRAENSGPTLLGKYVANSAFRNTASIGEAAC